jgi:hypothetical protein
MPEYTTTEAAFLMAHNERIRELEQENERLRLKLKGNGFLIDELMKDAERYRWLKAHNGKDPDYPTVIDDDGNWMDDGLEIDEAIDEAMSGSAREN